MNLNPAADHRAGSAIPFLDLVSQHRTLEEELVAAFRRALATAGFVGGSEVTAFEEEFAAFTGTLGTVGLSNGTDALRLAYLTLGVDPGDEIVTVPNTFIATTETITQAGGVVKFVDVDADSMTMNPTALRAAITRSCRSTCTATLRTWIQSSRSRRDMVCG